jgi:hypothetical protein
MLIKGALKLRVEILPKFGFGQFNIESVTKIIKNSLADIQESLSDNILHDAIYYYLGCEDYPVLVKKLLRERKEYGKYPDSDWIEIQKKFLSDHEFRTTTGRFLRRVSVKEQLDALNAYSK